VQASNHQTLDALPNTRISNPFKKLTATAVSISLEKILSIICPIMHLVLLLV
jgi:hypothetical protein